jgi:hypothetical protein
VSGKWELTARDAGALLRQGWIVAALVERHADDMPEEVLFEARALAAMTGEYVEGTNPYTFLLASMGIEPA